MTAAIGSITVLGMAPPSSRVVAVWMRHADQHWFSTALRARLKDGDRQEWKDRFVARSLSLRARWRNMEVAARQRDTIASMPSEHDRIDSLIDGSDEMLAEARTVIKSALKQRHASRQALLNLHDKIAKLPEGYPGRNKLIWAYEKLQRKLVDQASLIVDLMGSLEHEVVDVAAIAKKHL
jgi:hypothetical protein